MKPIIHKRKIEYELEGFGFGGPGNAPDLCGVYKEPQAEIGSGGGKV